jgi:hypothetical protein
VYWFRCDLYARLSILVVELVSEGQAGAADLQPD